MTAVNKFLNFNFSQPRVMGILNMTPDSFADGSSYNSLEAALRRSERMVFDGADIIDVGGESTRPGAQAVSEGEELDRVIPVVESISRELGVPVSIDTSKPMVMKEAVNAGACFVNDVKALTEVGALDVVAKSNVFVCLMHMKGEPRTMQLDPHYEDVVSEVKSYLLERVRICEAAGISRDKLVLDPGFGFGKTLDHNVNLLRDLKSVVQIGLPVLAGLSRKSMLGVLLGADDAPLPVEQRLSGSIAAAVIALIQGAKIIRVHDVKETVQAVKIVTAICEN